VWTHLAGTYDGTTLRLFVNGVQAGSTPISGAIATSAGVLRIGGNSLWGEFFQGRIDEVRIYNRALSAAEIQTDMVTPVGGAPPADTTPPVRSGGLPTGTLPAGTTQATLSLSTNESATCRYATTAGTAYASMPSTFTTTGATALSTTVAGLAGGGSYSFFVRCQDGAGNANPDDLAISFAVAQPADTTPPGRSGGLPTGILPAGTTQTTLSLATDENATCRHATTAGTPYAAMPNAFTTTGTTTHATTVGGLSEGTAYAFHVRCQDAAGNANTTDFTIGFSVPDITPPGRTSGQPTGVLPAGTTETTLSLATDENATCRYDTTAGTPYAAMPGTFSTTGTTTHSTTVSIVSDGVDYTVLVRCQDAAGNANTSDFAIDFSVAQPAGLVAAYGFNDGGGTSVADASGQGHTGAISGATWTADGRFGHALSFDGVSDWVTIEHSDALSLTTGMTLEAWIFPTAPATDWRNVLIKERPGGEAYNLYASTDNGGPTTYIVTAGPSAPLDAVGVTAVPVDTWTHLAATYDGTTLRLYVNGVQAGSRAVNGALVASTAVLRIGGNSIWGEFFQGHIDEVRIYNRALSAAEIQADMTRPITP
jgi:hypothetical protein